MLAIIKGLQVISFNESAIKKIPIKSFPKLNSLNYNQTKVLPIIEIY